MGKTIHLDKEVFDLVKSGKKKFEIRLGNKDINEGDILKIIQKTVNKDKLNILHTFTTTHVDACSKCTLKNKKTAKILLFLGFF